MSRSEEPVDRSKGAFFRLQNFHNAVKFKLLESVVEYFQSKGITKLSLLDVSAGKGGDGHKWDLLGIKNFVGIDPSENSIKEAKRRFPRTANRFIYTPPDSTAITADWSVKKPKLPQKLFDIVSCQMSLHYFFENEVMLENAIKNISDSLMPGGIFIGTSYDGSAMFPFIKNRKFVSNIKDLKDYIEFEVLDKSQAGITPAYIMKWKSKKGAKLYMEKELEQDTKLNIDKEFFVDKAKFFNMCKKYDLFPVSIDEFLKVNRKTVNFKPFEEWYKKIVEKGESVKLYKTPKDMAMRDHERFISFMHMSFVFIKKINLLETSN